MAMKDGFKTLIKFGFLAGEVFPEVSVKPFGLDGRGPIDITSMRNTRYTTKWPKQLMDLTPIQADVQWSPSQMVLLKRFVIQVNQPIEVTMPTGDLLTFYGWLDKAEPQPQKEGEVPICQFTIIPSNMFASLLGSYEVGPLLNGVSF